MNPSQTFSRKYLQQAIDAEINSLKESIRALKYRRNALSPVSSLPPEVFAAIFSFLYLPGNDVPGGRLDPRLGVSHVCHQWREIALNQPLLWNRIDFTSLSSAGAAEILDRAKSAPLYLKANLSSSHRREKFDAFRKELQTRVPDICHLRISASPYLLNSTLEGLISPAPSLDHLSLSSCRGHGRSRMRMDNDRSYIPDTLFDSSTPRLSYLELCNCNISWRSPLFKRLKNLKIFTPSVNARPGLAVWLSALDEMPQLTTLTLHLASPIAPPFPFHVKRTVILPSLTCLALLASPEDCALALAHLDLPALASLSLTVQLLDTSDVQKLLPFVIPHAHGSQDALPLQCVLIRSERNCADILAWPVPNINAKVTVYDLPTLLPAATLPTRISLSFRSRDDELSPEQCLEIVDTVLACLPLDGLVMFEYELGSDWDDDCGGLETQDFWCHLSSKWHLLQCVRLTSPAGFLAMLLEDDGGRERPLLPSLTQLVFAKLSQYYLSLLPLREVLMKRIEQGVPVEILDLHNCHRYLPMLDLHKHSPTKDWLQSLSEIGVDVLGPGEAFDAMEPRFCAVVHDPFVDKDHSITGSDDEYEAWYEG
jgi:hypothetical protein